MDNISLTIRRCKRGNEPKLILSSKELTSIPSEVFQLASLQTLDLSNNKITNLDFKISSLENLVSLDLSKNLLAALPSSILSLKNLNNLNLTDNPLSSTFELLLKKENQTGFKLQETLKKIFESLTNEDKGKNSAINFFEDENSKNNDNFLVKNSNTLTQSSLLTQLVNTEKLLKLEEQKVNELTKQVERLKMGRNPNSELYNGGGFLNLEEKIMQSSEIEMSELKMGEVISQGGFSIVYRGMFRGTEVAIKNIFDPIIRPELLAELTNEITMLKSLNHPNIVLLMGVVSKPPNLCIITEFLPNGNLFDLLHKSKKVIKPVQCLQIARQIAVVCLYLHKSKVVHRDLKSLNILLDENFKVKLCDFGLARHFNELNKGTMQFSGTPSYLAPEVYQKKAYDEKIDVFAYGTMLWEIFARSVPYEGLDPPEIYQKVAKGEGLGGVISKGVSRIVNECRSLNSENRPDFEKIVDMLNNVEV